MDEILKMGLPAERAGSGPPPHRGDLIINGEFVSINEGSRLKRMLIGFGAGSAELMTFVEGYQVTADGLRPLKSVEVKAAGGRMPGMLVPVVGGAVAGSAGTSVAISGSLNVAQEMGPESIEGAAKRTANEIGKVLSEPSRRRTESRVSEATPAHQFSLSPSSVVLVFVGLNAGCVVQVTGLKAG